MKNLHLIPTDKPSRLSILNSGKLNFGAEAMSSSNSKLQYIYITSDEEIKEGDYFLYDGTKIRYKSNGTEYHGRDLCHISGNHRYPVSESKKIILTTDQDLIKNGVQAIDDIFLEWFVENPSCDEVKVEDYPILKSIFDSPNDVEIGWQKKIIIPQEEPKQELEKELFELEQELDIPSSMRWHNSKPKQETIEEAAREYWKRGQFGLEKAADTELAFLKGAKSDAARDYWFEQFKKKGGDK
jgi:hypothetical protein